MVSKKILRKIIDKKDEIPEKFSKIRALSKFDFSRVFEFAVKEVIEAKKANREPDIQVVSRFAPDMDEEIIREFIEFSKDLVSCWEKEKDNLEAILSCLKGEQ